MDAQGGDKTLDSALCTAYRNVDQVGHRLGIVFRWISNWLPGPHMTDWSRLGRDTPPMFGDYEAQRHWMEITLHLPFQQWYTYDLQYWGLDYPPLTAYVSWLCGKLCVDGQRIPTESCPDDFVCSGSWMDPSWFALEASRGIETDGSKVYMRATVLACDLLYVWAVIMFTRTIQATRSVRTQVRTSRYGLSVWERKR